MTGQSKYLYGFSRLALRAFMRTTLRCRQDWPDCPRQYWLTGWLISHGPFLVRRKKKVLMFVVFENE